LLLAASLWSVEGLAHLMNMSQARGSVDTSGELRLVMRMDLQRQLGGAAAYHRLSTLGAAAAPPN